MKNKFHCLKKISELGLAVGMFVGQNTSAWASQSDPFQFFEEEAKVTSATLHPQKISAAPATAYVITARDIEQYGYRTLAEALQSIPGVFGTDSREAISLWFRDVLRGNGCGENHS